VVQRCPQNGWRPYFTADPECPRDICCVGCAQRFYLELGHTPEQVESGPIPCDFYSYATLAEHGWEEGETFSGEELASTEGRAWRDYCSGLMGRGYLVLTDQGRTGLGNGYPDTVTVYFKEAA
jgi:hypothetical protein